MIDWRAYLIAFIAVAGWQEEQNRGLCAGDWVDVADMAATLGVWRWRSRMDG